MDVARINAHDTNDIVTTQTHRRIILITPSPLLTARREAAHNGMRALSGVARRRVDKRLP